MSFTFGNTSSAFSSPAKPTTFGTPLSFGTPATTASTGFGGFGSTFGAGSTQQPAFGSTFGQPAAASTAPAFGSTFGQTSTGPPAFGTSFVTSSQSVPSFGSSFGTQAAAAPAFGSTFGASTAAPNFGSAFGAPATSASPFANTFGASTSTQAFGSTFGTPATTAPNMFANAIPKNFFSTPSTTTPSLFGAPAAAPSLFGTGTTTQAPSLFGGAVASTSTTPSLFGTTTSTQPSLFGSTFGSTATTNVPSLFGGTGTGFGLGASTAPTTNFNFFGGPGTTTSAPSLFSGFGKTTTASGFTGFGTGTTTGFGGFGAPAAAPFGTNLFGSTTQPAVRLPSLPGALHVEQIQHVLTSIYGISIFGDERDSILKKWNLLQASWGMGKGYFNTAQVPIEYTVNNPFFRYKAIGYNIIPSEENADGIVKLIFNKKESELSNQREVLSNGILGILGNKPNLTVTINTIKASAENQTEVAISVSEKGVTGTSRKILANDLAAFLNQPVQKQQLSNVGVVCICPWITPTKTQLQEYSKHPPMGVELQTWQAAHADNPNPEIFMPVLMNGFSDLKRRMLFQEHETVRHRKFLEKVDGDISELKKKHASSIARITELKEKYSQLQHRLLKIIVKQEVTRKLGIALQPEEEQLRTRFEAIIAQLKMPNQFQGLLKEIKSGISHVKCIDSGKSEQYKMDPNVQEDIKQFLKMEQNGIAQLISIVQRDLKDLKIISEGLEKMYNK